MKTLIKIPVAILVTALLASCTKNFDSGMPSKDTGGLSKNASMSLKIIGSNAPTQLTTKKSSELLSSSSGREASNSGSSAGVYSFTQALLGIRDIEIKKMDESFDDSTEADTLKQRYDFDGDYLLNLITGTSTPSLNLANFVPGVYNKVEAKSAKIVNGKNSISLIGNFTDSLSKVVYNFDFSTVARLEFEFESDSGFTLNAGNVINLLVNINLPRLFAGIDFSKATKDSNGIIMINETSNSNLMARIITNIRHMHKGEGDHENGNEIESHGDHNQNSGDSDHTGDDHDD